MKLLATFIYQKKIDLIAKCPLFCGLFERWQKKTYQWHFRYL